MSNREQFIASMMPAAIEAGKRTGIDPRIIVAQAAHETGWGRSAPGNNFFGIKSHGQSGGQSLATQEVVNGQRVNVRDSFRRFDSPAASVAGYADFIGSNPRYRGVQSAQGLDAQVAALGASGYATDPNYGRAIGSIARSLPTPQGYVDAGPSGNDASAAINAAAPTQGSSMRSPLVSAMADRQLAAQNGQPPRPMVHIGLPQQDTIERAQDVMDGLGKDIKTPVHLLGDLAQAWAASSQIKNAKATEASELQKAYAEANLDAPYALAAQLSGTRGGLIEAVMGQQQARTAQANRAEDQAWRQQQFDANQAAQGRDEAWRQSQADYSHGQDATANARADRSLTLQETIANRKAEGFKTLSPEEAASQGLPPGQSYQMGSDGKVYPISGPKSGGGVTISPDGTVQIGGGGVKVPTNFMPDPSNPGAVTPIPGGPGEQLSADLAGRIGLADSFLGQVPELQKQVGDGAVTGVWDRLQAGNNSSSDQASAYRKLQSGADALTRMLTGAGMNEAEAKAYADRYLPGYGDDAASAGDKLSQLEREIRSAREVAMRGRGGAPGSVSGGASGIKSKYGLE